MIAVDEKEVDGESVEFTQKPRHQGGQVLLGRLRQRMGYRSASGTRQQLRELNQDLRTDAVGLGALPVASASRALGQ